MSGSDRTQEQRMVGPTAPHRKAEASEAAETADQPPGISTAKSRAKATRRSSYAVADLLIVAVVTVAASALAVIFDLFEQFVAWTRPVEYLELDELPVMLFILSLACAWYAYRRWKELTTESRRRQQTESALVESERQYRHLVVEVVITDLLMPEQEGLATIKELRQDNPTVKIIAISGGLQTGSLDFLQVAEYLGAQQTLHKPFRRDELLGAIQAVLTAPREEAHNRS